MDHVYTSPGAVPNPQVDFRPFMWTAAVGSLSTHDITPYATAWAQLVSRLGSDQAVQNLHLPTPAFFSKDINNPIAITFDMQEYLEGLWLAEWALANPDQMANITWWYFLQSDGENRPGMDQFSHYGAVAASSATAANREVKY